MRHLLRRDPAPLVGDFFSLAGGDTLRWPAIRPDIPILLGTWGPHTLKACMGDYEEVKIGGSTNPYLIPHFRRVLADAGDGAGRIGIAIGAVCVVDEDGAAARMRARREVALYLPVVAALDPTLTIEPERLRRIGEAASHYDFEMAAGLIDDDLLARFAFAGAPEEVAAQARRLLDAGAQRVEFGTPHGLTPQQGLRLLGETRSAGGKAVVSEQ